MTNDGRALTKNTLILSFGTICTKGIMFIMTPLFIRWLPQSDYGTFDLAINYITLVLPILTLDIGEAVFRFMMNDDENGKSIISNAIISETIGFIIGSLSALIFGIAFPQYRNILNCFYLVLIAEGAYTFFGMAMRGLKKLPLYTIANIIYVIAMAVSSIVFIRVLDLGLNGIFYSYAFGYAVSAVYMGIGCHINRLFSWREFNWQVLKKMLRYSVPLIPNAIGWWIINVSDKTIVSFYMGSEANAILAVTHKLPNLMQTLYSRFHLSWQQSASESIDSPQRDKFFSSVLDTMLTVMASITVLMLSTNILFFKFIYTGEYFSGYYIAPILLLALLIYTIAQFLGGVNIAKMESKKNGATTALGAGVNIIVHLILIRFVGLYAAAISTFVAYSVVFIARYFDVHREITFRLKPTTWLLMAFVLYFFVACYVGGDFFHYINIAVALLVCFIFNKNNIFRILHMRNRR